MKIKNHLLVLAALLLANTGGPLSAQLVADGTTAAINATSTNLTSDLIIGTNGAFTTLVIANAGAVTNSGNGIIGQNLTALTNQVIVTGPNSIWSIGGNLNFGQLGSYSRLTVTNGGRVDCNFGNMGFNAGSGNLAIVTGANSVWTNRNGLNVGNIGNFNRLVVTDGGRVESGSIINIGNVSVSNQLLIASGGRLSSVSGTLGNQAASKGNVAVITDAGSQWTSVSGPKVGENSAFNQLFITNGGKIFSGGAYVGGNEAQSGSGTSNSVVITDTGSAWTNTGTSSVGNFGKYNRLTISNGGVMRNTASFASLVLGWQPAGGNNTVVVTGTNSLFSNLGTFGAMTVGQGSSFNQLLVSDGGVVETDTGELAGNSVSSNNVAVVTDPGSRWFSRFAFYVGNAGSGNQLTVQNSGLVSTPTFYLGNANTSSNNTTIVTGGSIIVTNLTSTGIADVRRGALTLNSGLVRANIFLLTNGTQSQFTFNGGTLQTGSTVNSNGSPFTVGDGASPATLELVGNGTHVFPIGLQITNNALLKGSGTIVGNFTNASGGTLSPGASIGKLIVNGNVTLADGSTNVFELDKSSGTNDNLTSLTSVTYGGTLQLTNLSGTLAGGDAYKLFTATSYGGAFSALVPSTPGAGMEWDTNSLTTDGTLRILFKPYITSQPTNKTVFVGQNATFNVTAAGTASLSYQWRFAGTDIGGATTNSYTRANAQPAHAGGYTVVITNYLGSVTSDVATLTVNVPGVATNIVISQIYGGGNNSGATYRSDFVELFNASTNTINLAAWSIQYAAGNSSSWSVGNLRASIAPYGYYLVQMFSGIANGIMIPTADATNTINMSATAGKVALVTDQIPLSGANPVGAITITDFVGFGNASAFEGTGPASGPVGNATAVLRKNGGFTESNDNANDFTTLTPPAPRNTASPANPPVVPVIPATLGSPSYATNNQFQFTVTGTAGTNYIVQGATNLATTNWLALFTNTAPFNFVETNASVFPQRFYRAVFLP